MVIASSLTLPPRFRPKAVPAILRAGAVLGGWGISRRPCLAK